MIKRTQLNNGIRVLSEKVPGCHSVSLGVWVNNGSRHESAEINGVSHFAEHMFFKGTDRRSAQCIAREVDSVGGFLNGFTSREISCYFVKVLAEKLSMAVDLLGDMVCHSQFDQEEVEKERKVILQEIAMFDDSPEESVHDLFSHAFWSNHTLGMPVIGTQETVGGISRDSLLKFMNNRYIGENLCVVAAGSLDHEQLVDLVEQAFADVPVSGGDYRAVAPIVERHIDVTCKDLEQTHICLGVEGLPQHHDDRYGTFLLSIILGGNMSSRLFQKVREEMGMAYSVYSFHHNHSDSGAFIVYAGTSGEEAPVTVKTVLEEMSRFVDEPVTAEELQSAKDFLKGSMVLALESTDNRMTRLAKNELFLRDIGTSFEESQQMIDAVSADMVRDLAAKMFIDETLNLQVVGRVEQDQFPSHNISFNR